MRLFVIPGHGAGDPGACGNGYSEAERVRALATKIKQYGGSYVKLADFSRNYYEDAGICSLDLPDDYQIVELHMDSGVPTAHGGHVIIQEGIGGADQYDRNLAKAISNLFPGRAEIIVERGDLANPGRAAAKGYGYRLIENGFISNAGDVKTFNAKIDELAIAYLKAFGITPSLKDDVYTVTASKVQVRTARKNTSKLMTTLRKGDKVRLKDIKKNKAGNAWGEISSGAFKGCFVLVKTVTGKSRLKKG